jgi:hypothetical protein
MSNVKLNHYWVEYSSENGDYTPCDICESETWDDEDLHWTWCYDSKCLNSFNNPERVASFLEQVEEKEKKARERDAI